MLQRPTYPTLPLAEALWPRASLLRELTLILLGSWLVALSAQIEIPLWPVPITGQTLAVLLVGALLGSRRGALSLLAYLAQGAAGLPVFAGASGGLAKLVGPTGGYLLGFVLAAWLVGWLSERGWDRSRRGTFLAMLLGNLVIYTLGLPWLAQFTGWEKVLALGFYPFLLGDLLKMGLAALLLPQAWQRLGPEKS